MIWGARDITLRVGYDVQTPRDVPSNCVVPGVPARIIRLDGVRCDEPLGGSPDRTVTLTRVKLCSFTVHGKI
jgi:hypothetical protein